MNIYISQPKNFIPAFEAAGCLCEWKNKFLLVKRNPNKPYGNTWGLPGGKLEKEEGAKEAVIREMFEETGIYLKDDESLTKAMSLFVRHECDYIFHVFRLPMVEQPELKLNINEHLEGQWCTLEEALNLPLIIGAKEMFSFLFP